jgi:hypothetical protein
MHKEGLMEEFTPFSVTAEEYENFKKQEFTYDNQRIDDTGRSVFSLMADDLETFSTSDTGKTVLNTLFKEL